MSNYGEIIAYYNELAKEYDQRYQNPELAYMHSIESEVLLKKVREIVLDIGCGTGRHSILLANRSYRTVGIDISSEMVKIARAKSGAGADFLIATAEALPFKSCSVNSVISIFGALNHVIKYKQAYDEIARVLKPDGVFIFTVVNRWNLTWWLKSFFTLKWKWLLTALRKSEYTNKVWTHYYSADELKQLLSAKFKNLQLGCLLLFIYPKFKFSSGSLSNKQRFFSKIENLLRWRYPFNRLGYYIIGIAYRNEDC